jgi:hypothetical protein
MPPALTQANSSTEMAIAETATHHARLANSTLLTAQVAQMDLNLMMKLTPVLL